MHARRSRIGSRRTFNERHLNVHLWGGSFFPSRSLGFLYSIDFFSHLLPSVRICNASIAAVFRYLKWLYPSSRHVFIFISLLSFSYYLFFWLVVVWFHSLFPFDTFHDEVGCLLPSLVVFSRLWGNWTDRHLGDDEIRACNSLGDIYNVIHSAEKFCVIGLTRYRRPRQN